MKDKKIISEKIYKLKQKAVDDEAFNLYEEFKEIFGADLNLAQEKIERITDGMTEEEIRQTILNRYALYEVLLDNSVEEIRRWLNEQNKKDSGEETKG